MSNDLKPGLLERHLDRRLNAEEQVIFDALRSTDPAFQTEVERGEALQTFCTAAGELKFAPNFAARVMARLSPQGASGAEDWMDLIWRYFPRVTVPASVLTVLVLAANLFAAPEGTPLVPALFGLPEGQLAAAIGVIG